MTQTVKTLVKKEFKMDKLIKDSIVRNCRTVQIESSRKISRDIKNYKIDTIISKNETIKGR